MPLPTSTTLSPLDPLRPVRELTFVESEVGGKQARFRDRRVLTPTLDLKGFRFKAVVDFVVVRVFTNRTQFQWIQQALRTVLPRDSWITSINPGRGTRADEFDIRIQEPQSTAVVAEAIAAVGAKRGERRAPQIREIEFSLDVYSRDGAEDKREQMIGLLQRTYYAATDRWADELDMPRSTAAITAQPGSATTTEYLPPVMGEKREDSLTVRPSPEEFRSPFLDGTMYMGEKGTSGMIRIQNKEKDQQNPSKGAFKQLTEDQKRARVEVTLKCRDLHDLGLYELPDLKGFKYTKLQKKFFQFMLPTFANLNNKRSPAIHAANGLEEEKRAEIFLKSGLLALMRRDEVWEEHVRSTRPEVKKVFRRNEWPIIQNRVGRGATSNVIAYEALNKEVSTAFRHLGEREYRAWLKR
ncbi:hypothetical protein [uncultured Ruegeria sp.]|uniref:hypothetical protein n=1 Tax=uncultured Ruegeria sp. TaxID=259304 RepID=UPI00260B0D7A|nr:hypothetical protein [uncultured Ruegeria sp.]